MSDDIPPYSSEPYPGYTPLETNTLAIISVVSGVLGWLGVFGLGGLVAVITGHIAKQQIRDSAGRQGGDGLATAGLVLGYLNLALTLLAVCLVILIVTGVISGVAICPFLIDPSTY